MAMSPASGEGRTQCGRRRRRRRGQAQAKRTPPSVTKGNGWMEGWMEGWMDGGVEPKRASLTASASVVLRASERASVREPTKPGLPRRNKMMDLYLGSFTRAHTPAVSMYCLTSSTTCRVRPPLCAARRCTALHGPAPSRAEHSRAQQSRAGRVLDGAFAALVTRHGDVSTTGQRQTRSWITITTTLDQESGCMTGKPKATQHTHVVVACPLGGVRGNLTTPLPSTTPPPPPPPTTRRVCSHGTRRLVVRTQRLWVQSAICDTSTAEQVDVQQRGAGELARTPRRGELTLSR
ncbi:hypothetical protein SVAN01_06526 [Stagonosporopsis vannaccii]|nr:hypothetical protein SVAN01_06526 [Stagonosporopsis vannaccii]